MTTSDSKTNIAKGLVGSSSLSNLLGTSNIGLLLAFGLWLQGDLTRQLERAEETAQTVAKVQVHVETIARKTESTQEQLTQLKSSIAELQESTAKAQDVQALKARVEALEKCVKDRKQCNLG